MTEPITSTSEAAGANYSLTLVNNSAATYTFYVFQKLPDQSPNIFSLAWFVSPFTVKQGNQVRFDWGIDYCFLWGSTGTLRPGVTFHAEGAIATSPDGANTTTFTTYPGPILTKPVSGSPQGSLVISDDSKVPANQFSVGIGMSGASTFAIQAGPNLTHRFTPTPSYWIGAGSNIQVGDVLGVTTTDPVTTSDSIEQVGFPPNVYDLTYALNPSNQWELQQN